jgi:MFS family permease
MGLWGVYFDMYGFGLFDFIGRATNPKDHSDGFGLIQIFRSLGLLVAPIIAGYFISESINFSSLKVGWIFLGIGFIFFIILSLLTKNMVDKFIEHEGPKLRPKKNALFEAKLLVKLSNELRSPLIITFFLFLVEAFFWTLAPLFAQSQTMKDFGGIFLAAYSLPPLIIGWFVGRITSKFGKKKTAIIGIMLGSIFIFSILYITNPIVIIAAAFIGSCFFGIALPSINGAYADYISEASYVEGEIEALEDFSFNLGYIIGPISAGIISDLLGMTSAFAVLGLLGFVTALVLLKITPKSIDIKI